MTTTVAEFLFGPDDVVRARLLEKVRATPVLKRLTKDAQHGVAAELERLLREALGDRLVDVLFAQVEAYERLQHALEVTRADPRSVERVLLAECGWKVEYAPSVTLDVNDHPILTLEARAALVLRVGELTAVVRGGRVIELRADSMGVGGKLWLQGEVVLERHRRLPIGVVLVVDGDRAAVRAPTPSRRRLVDVREPPRVDFSK